MDRELTRRLKIEGLRLGFDQVGVAPAVTPPHYTEYLGWLQAGHAAGMDYLTRQAEVRQHPDRLLEGARSVIVASLLYGQPEPDPPGPTEGKVARYARGADYHSLFWRKLDALLEWLQNERPGTLGRSVSDSAPLLERDFARLAGLGWVGKNTMLIDKRLGSYSLLGAIVTDADLEPDVPHDRSHCGTCTRCLDACPTEAFSAPHTLDSRKCISYWTIEHRGPIDEAFADRLEGWVFGCDVCQDVCPWNRKAPTGKTPELAPLPGLTNPDLIAWLNQDPSEFVKSLKGTSLSRAKRSGLLRNAALILGTRRVAEAIPALTARLDDPDPVVRDAAAWALRRLGTDAASLALDSSGERERGRPAQPAAPLDDPNAR
ncbi:MAG: tRNA epoxyqueuosine(34) reductase QueG [Isosphaeraceae bacterium]